MIGRHFTKDAVAVINLAARIADDEDYMGWDEKKQEAEPAVDWQHILAAAKAWKEKQTPKPSEA